MKKTLRAEQWGERLRLVVTQDHSARRPKKWTEKIISGPTNYEFENFPPLDLYEPIDCTENWTYSIYERGKNNGRFTNNIARARTRVREIALCNDWEFFYTFTLDASKQDRYDLKSYVQSLGVWVGNFNKRYETHLGYLFIPEQHKDGAWHGHGLLHNVPLEALQKNKFGYLSIPYYERRFGFVSLSPIRNKVACAAYITKYISKDMGSTNLSKGQRSFYSSRGLLGRRPLFECSVAQDYPSAWGNEWVGITWGAMPESMDRLAHYRREIQHGRNPFLNGYEYEPLEERAKARIQLAEWRMWHEFTDYGKETEGE